MKEYFWMGTICAKGCETIHKPQNPEEHVPQGFALTCEALKKGGKNFPVFALLCFKPGAMAAFGAYITSHRGFTRFKLCLLLF
jgi:hypothetical protein